MAPNEKPQVDVPVGEAPSYQLEIEDLEVGEGDEAVSGKTVEVHYVGKSWSNGKEFDSSWKTSDAQTLPFTVCSTGVIPGFAIAPTGMKVGGRRRLTIPAHKAYGERGAGGVIKPGATLVFVVDLVGVR